MKKTIPVLSGLLAGLIALSLVGCDGGEDNGSGGKWTNQDEWLTAYDAVPTEAYTLPTAPAQLSNVTVHDPSIFYDEASSTYYAFGTHFAVASTQDFMKWTQVVSEYQPEKLYGTSNWRSVLKQADNYVGNTGGITSTWAPDVEKIGNKYYMYVSVTEAFGSSKSIIVQLSADNVLGPYGNERVVVRSDGSGASNAIDPELFYDKDGRLWMVYGSNYGGLFIRELNTSGKNVGLPKEGGIDDLGELIWTASGNNEGPYIFYNAETDYYYLMTSYGSLATDYNMRIARSENPNGPYYDVGNHWMDTESGFGNKLAGNYRFSGDQGWAALGHNSVIKVDGKYLVIHHTRWESSDGGVDGGHRVQVRQLFFNKEGWPVMAPNRYAGESAGMVTAEDVAGTYDIVLHTEGTSATFVDSVSYTLNADHTISTKNESDETVVVANSSWELDETGYYITVTLNNYAYSGVVVPQWCGYKNGPILSITATSSTGRALWANGAPIRN